MYEEERAEMRPSQVQKEGKDAWMIDVELAKRTQIAR